MMQQQQQQHYRPKTGTQSSAARPHPTYYASKAFSMAVHQQHRTPFGSSASSPTKTNNNWSSTQTAAQISRTSGGNSSFTAASITRRELSPNGREDSNHAPIGRSVENLNELLLLKRGTNIARVGDSSPRGLIRNFSQRVKSQVQCTLSEPLKGISERLAIAEEINNTHREQAADNTALPKHYHQHPQYSHLSSMKRSSSVKRCVSALSSRLKQLADEDISNTPNICEGEPPEPHGYAGGSRSSSEDSFEEDQEFLELQEREQIVDKYERGPDSKDVDPWENPDFELYQVTDRYGFVHKPGELTTEEQAQQKRKQKELSRERKWLHMLEEWERRHPAKLPERIWKGVPDKLRLVIWLRMLGVAEMKANSRENLYKELLMRARLVSKDIKQIDLDINRTYRDHLAFRRRYDVKQQSLFNVLAAYAMLNTEVGYCQGMSQIAAVFLMYMDEEDAFWCLHALLVNRKYGMHGFFVPGFPKLQRFQHHYEKVLLKYLPRVKKHLDNSGIPPIYLTKWWFGCFLDRVPFSLALRIWDVFLYYGDCVLIAMAYNIMKIHKKRILKLSIEEFMEFIQTTLADNFGFPDDTVMESLEECLRRLQNDRMAIPPPSNPDAPAELPTKPLGPVLTRSMMDIRSDIASIYSRCSRTNSLAHLHFVRKYIDEVGEEEELEPFQPQSALAARLALSGRSPMMHRHHTHKAVTASPMAAAGTARLQQQLSNNRAVAQAQQMAVDGKARAGSVKEQQLRQESGNATNNVREGVVSPPVEPFLRRVGSTKHRIPKPPPVPDEDGFVRMGPRSQRKLQQQHQNSEEEGANVTANRKSSQYDNVAEPAQNADEITSRMSGRAARQQQQRSSSLKHYQTRQLQRAADSTEIEHRQQWSTGSGSSSGHRVHKAPNNVTYIALDDADDNKSNDGLEWRQGNGVDARMQQKLSQRPPYERMPSRLPYYCPPPDYDDREEDRRKQQRRAGNNGVQQQSMRVGSDRTPQVQRQRLSPMAQPLFARDETVVRRF